jgi:MscS family membrane protein
MPRLLTALGARSWRGAVTLLLILLLVPIGLLPTSAPARLLPALDTSSPYATMQSFEREMERIAELLAAYRARPSDRSERALRDAVHRAADQLLDLREVPPATQARVGTRSLFELADILLRLPAIPPESIPGAPGHAEGPVPARWTLPGTEIRIERIGADEAPRDFRFSASTVARMGAFHAAMISEPPLRPAAVTQWRRTQIESAGPLLPEAALSALPRSLRSPVLETPVWKILASAAVILVCLAAMLAWLALIRRSAQGLARWRRIARWLSVPLMMVIALLGAHHLIDRHINLTGTLADAETLAVTILLYVAGAWAMALACRLIAEAIIASPRVPDASYDSHLLRLMARVAGFVGAAIVLVYGAAALGLPALGLAAGLGVGGVALALASQSTVENLFGGVSIFADRPFRVGDAIRFGELTGVVETIGLRSTRIRAPDGMLTTVPNADIARAHVTNLSVRNRFLFDHRVSMPPAADAGHVGMSLAALRRLLEEHPLVEKSDGMPRVRLVGLAPEAITIHLLAQVLTADEETFLQVQERLLLQIMERLGQQEGAGAAGAGADAPGHPGA